MTNKNKAPYTSELGEPGEERNICCELKLLADVGLVGFPSVGKSSLISVISAAKPKIADYHFTTLVPNLGVVKAGDYSYVVADLPGMIEGSSEGVGLGDKFLRHASRCRVVCHVLDMGEVDGRNVIDDYKIIRNEIKKKLRLIMIDEYQDTSKFQEEFIDLIANNNVFVVGDVKQSIYGFRDANPKQFIDKYELYKNNSKIYSKLI